MSTRRRELVILCGVLVALLGITALVTVLRFQRERVATAGFAAVLESEPDLHAHEEAREHLPVLMFPPQPVSHLPVLERHQGDVVVRASGQRASVSGVRNVLAAWRNPSPIERRLLPRVPEDDSVVLAVWGTSPWSEVVDTWQLAVAAGERQLRLAYAYQTAAMPPQSSRVMVLLDDEDDDDVAAALVLRRDLERRLFRFCPASGGRPWSARIAGCAAWTDFAEIRAFLWMTEGPGRFTTLRTGATAAVLAAVDETPDALVLAYPADRAWGELANAVVPAVNAAKKPVRLVALP